LSNTGLDGPIAFSADVTCYIHPPFCTLVSIYCHMQFHFLNSTCKEGTIHTIMNKSRMKNLITAILLLLQAVSSYCPAQQIRIN